MITRPRSLNLEIQLKILELLKYMGTQRIAQHLGVYRQTVLQVIRWHQASSRQ